MFTFFAVSSMIGYGLQNILLVRFARKIDALSLAFYRNISFFFTLLPLLIGAKAGDFTKILLHWPTLLLSGFLGALYLVLNYETLRYLPVGIASALTRATTTLILIVFGWFFLHETLSPITLGLIALILIGSTLLGLERNPLPHLSNKFSIGLTLVLLSALPLAGVNSILAHLSRSANPLVASYFWEVSIGLVSFLLICGRWLASSKSIEKIDLRQFLIIAGCSAPTLIGTGFYSLATRIGPVAVTNAIGSGSLIISSVLAWIFYQETLTKKQCASMALIILAIIALKFL